MKLFKNTSLYSRLALITSVTLVVGYFVVYAWTTLDPADAGPTKTLTATLMQGIVNNINDLNTRVSNFGFSAGNVGIGTASPGYPLSIAGGNGTSLKMSLSNLTPSTGHNYTLNSSSDGKFYIWDDTAVANRFMIDPTGKVWIGTTAPGDTLTVNGGVTANTFTSPVAWSAITPATGWTSESFSCRRIGSFLQLDNYIMLTSLTSTIPPWSWVVATLPVECRPSIVINYPAWSCWDGTTTAACIFQIGTAGDIRLYSRSSIIYFSASGTYPAN